MANPILAKAIDGAVVYATYGKQVVEGRTLINLDEAGYRALGFAELPPVTLGNNQHAEYSAASRTVRKLVPVETIWEGGKEPVIRYEERDVLEWYIVGAAVDNPPHAYDDYDKAMEDYLYEVRAARGWTTREPDTIKTSNERYKQDGIDFADFRDRVYAYVLPLLNQYIETGVAPDWDEYNAGLRAITCNWTLEAVQ